MKIHNIFVEKIESEILLNKEQLKHLRVLRIKENEVLHILNGKGIIGEGFYYNGRVIIKKKIIIKEKPFINVFIPFLKQKAHRFILRNITSFPINEIIFYPSQYSAVKRKIDEKDKILLIESIKQSGNPFLPKISKLSNFSQIKSMGFSIFGAMNKGESNKSANLYSSKEISILIGPEGGLTKEEEEFLVARKFIPFSISPYTLRTETAIFSLLGGVYEIRKSFNV